MEEEKKIQEVFKSLFEQTSGTGEEELLRIASTYSRQISGYQMKLILFMKFLSNDLIEQEKNKVNEFIDTWLELKQYNRSAMFVMRALEYISLKKFLGENAIKVNVEK